MAVSIEESVLIALRSLWANKLRSFLTLLGIIIGVLTIISVVSVIQGLNNFVATKMSFYGANDFAVSKFSLIGGSLKQYREQLKRKNLTLEEMKVIREKCRQCELVGASVQTSRTVKFRNKSLKNTEIRGETAVDHLIGSVLELERGRFFLPHEENNSRFVAIIGWDLVENLFGDIDPLGKSIKIGPYDFRIIGVAKKRGKLLGMSQDNFVRIPITTFQKIYGAHRSIDINVHTTSASQMALAQEEVRTILRSLRHKTFKEPDDFSINTSDTFLNFYRSATSSIYLAMIAIASIALLVGGIVVMNIMLVSVTERINEIGIRLAVGARRKDILFQFLIEAAVLSGIGGLIGILFGIIVAQVFSAATSMPTKIEPVSVILAIFISTGTGLFFGLYPANKAARLNPIEALRSEL
ncbi:MAG: ABC transporter permease [Candidatus Aminicenantes bacterium]|nr:ABC transporter permease [Candidatus Aminicenantes bacterium]